MQPCYSQTISLEEFLELVKESHPFFAKEKLSVDIERKQNERLRLADDELQQAKRKRAANLVDEVDVLRAEDAVRIAKQNAFFRYILYVKERFLPRPAFGRFDKRRELSVRFLLIPVRDG